MFFLILVNYDNKICFITQDRTGGGGVGGRGGDSSRQIQRMDRFCLVCTVFKKIEPMFNI